MSWPRAWSKASRCVRCPSASKPCIAGSSAHIATRCRGFASQSGNGSSPPSCLGTGATRHMSEVSKARAKKRVLDRDFFVSVLEVSATKRDAKGYLQKYAGKNPKSLAEAPKFVQGDEQQQTPSAASRPLHVAIMKLRAPQEIDAETLRGVANTLSQLRKLGLMNVVVIDCGIEENRHTFQDQAFRLCEAIDGFGDVGARMVNNAFVCSHSPSPQGTPPSVLDVDVQLEDQGFIDRILRHGIMPVIPSLISRDELSPPQPVDSNKIVLALTKYFAGWQFDAGADAVESELTTPSPIALVERIILLDPLGAIPMTGRPGASHRFINLEVEYRPILKQLMGPDGSPRADDTHLRASITAHAANLALARDALELLPPTSSALITTPYSAANMVDTTSKTTESFDEEAPFEFDGLVTTRRKKNPLLHNLLTDKPVFSSSLPISRAPASNSGTTPVVGVSAGSTLLKRGMPLTIFPDPRENRWHPPQPGGPRLRLTDKCIDLPRLVHLIEDSFGRKLDVDDYLNRVNENIAGIIIAGDYEGGAILTWERPEGLDDQTAHEQGRYVPYLDKFAVLRKSQGSGGVADVVFNAMVRGCFPDGVCWRSRKDNPVNKWYFERSTGTNKLPGCNWTMFWTTPGLDCRHATLWDYETVCRGVEPSWADNKHILD
ncbi:hypothetical protein FZEAL_8002 [Fusarium zealandicum]|uniref:Amino-acid acetyltransferase, mitochondrial n=1 Tax=Fusarium zealandicum TaxID=1053134 RepID=A0A8H4UEM5_9HYPO|nr:hypothetical protein FZEAL_8002 [Fusarium zealandicum]